MLGAALVFALVLPQNFPALAQGNAEESKLAGDIFETSTSIPVTVPLASGRQHSGQMILTHYKPAGSGPFPIVIFNHGREDDRNKRAETPRFRELRIAHYFTRRGFAVFVPTRLGYGKSGIDIDPESTSGNCDSRDYRRVMDTIVAQSLATLNFAKTLRWTDKRRVLVVGHSYGGFGTIGANANSHFATLGGINFVGGAGGVMDKPGQPCGSSQVTAAIADAGKKSKAPMVWLYAENDKFWGSKLPRSWHAAYVGAGGKAEMVMFPPIEGEGHFLMNRGFRHWRPAVDRFLQRLGFSPPKTPQAPKSTKFARIEESNKLPYIKEAVKQEGYQKFLDADLPRAFAISPTGAWAWKTGDDAAARAMDHCRELSKAAACQLYAVDDDVVFSPSASAAVAP